MTPSSLQCRHEPLPLLFLLFFTLILKLSNPKLKYFCYISTVNNYFHTEPFQIMAQGKGGVSGGPPTQVNKLDNMLGSLQSDLNKLGVQTVAKGVCGACCKPIVGQVRWFG